MSRARKAYVPLWEQRKRRQDRQGVALLVVCALVLCGTLWGAYEIDKAHGISVSQSLHNAGL